MGLTKKLKQKRRMNKKAIFFSTDALIALTIILLTVLVVYPVIKSRDRESDVQGDIIKVLSSLKIGEINNSYVTQLRAEGKITDLNKSVLEQIGDFYVTNITIAKQLADSVLSTIDIKENVGIWYGDDLLISRNSTPFEKAKNIEVERQLISGISGDEPGESTTGFSARAYLTSGLQKKYFYFGGYVGDGNISVIVDYNGTLKNMDLEAAANTNFSICINECDCSGWFQPAESQFQPKNFTPYYPTCFHSGENIIKFSPTDSRKNLFFAGGFIKITYEDAAHYEPTTKYNFPGVEGLINIYDGFYVPGNLNDMEIFLHYNSNYTIFLNIGNVTVFSERNETEVNRTISDSTLKTLLNYLSLSQKTIPLRLGLVNASYVTDVYIDVFSVAELSGSVNQNVPEAGKKQLELIQNGNDVFITTVLKEINTRVGLVAYDGDADDETKNHNLSTDIASLNNTVYSWSGGEPTCICCGVNKAVEKLLSQSNNSVYQTIVLMSDGKANNKCSEQGTGDAKQDAIKSACDAYNKYNITVNTIGFGPKTTVDNETLINMSICGNGTYHYSNATQLADIYREVAHEIIEAAYKEQTMGLVGGKNTILYPDSYIKFNYTKSEFPYGLITTTEKQFSDKYSGSFSVSAGEPLEVVAISYSGARWTDNVSINGNSTYALKIYGSDYTKLGDPYAIHIPNSLVQTDNSVRVTTGVSPANSTEGSEYNKIIYKIKQNASSYSPVVKFAKGCIWHIQFEDGTTDDIDVPEDYSESGGIDNCYFKSSIQGINNNEDAVQIAVYNLLKLLDLNLNNKTDVKFAEQDLQVGFTQITGIPFAWSTEVQVRKWD